MKRTGILLLLCILAITPKAFAQDESQDTIHVKVNITTTEDVKDCFKKGQRFTITSVIRDYNKSGYKYFLVMEGAAGEKFTYDCSKKVDFPAVCDDDCTLEEFWNFLNISSLSKITLSVDASVARYREDIASNLMIDSLKNCGKFIDDATLIEYIRDLFLTAYPYNIDSPRPDFYHYDPSVFIVDEIEPYCVVLSNGFLTISSGLLAFLHTEDELMAILCNTCCSFIANHELENLIATTKKKNITAIIDVFSGGMATATMNLIDNFTFNRTQQEDADRAAVRALKLLGYDQNGLATGLHNITQYYNEEGVMNLVMRNTKKSYSYTERIKMTGIPYERRDKTFEERVSACVLHAANIRYETGRYRDASRLVKQNIDNDIAYEEDYCLYGNCLMKLDKSQEAAQSALNSFNKALSINREYIEAHKGFVLANMKLGNLTKASDGLHELTSLAGDRTDVINWIKNTKRQIKRMQNEVAATKPATSTKAAAAKPASKTSSTKK